jgi:hypothetical protein
MRCWPHHPAVEAILVKGPLVLTAHLLLFLWGEVILQIDMWQQRFQQQQTT